MTEEQPDRIIHQPVRTRIMAALFPLDPGAMLEFRDLKILTGASDGNLGGHITALEKARYIEVIKDFKAKRPRTRLMLSAEGRKAFDAYRTFLRALLDDGG
ncbi:transcriptional regulator [Iodidimonas nitroreducens]|nr:transcriptional regulator [Iodidimonas nitroreducens]